MIHLANIPHVLSYGITHQRSADANPAYVPIGDQGLIVKRTATPTPGGKNVGDFIPFYFGPRMPMLYCIQHGFHVPQLPPDEIVYCVSTVEKIQQLGLDFVYTDGHGSDQLSTNFYEAAEVAQLPERVDFEAVRAPYWNDESDIDLKRRKQAEFLVEGTIPPEAIAGYVVYNEAARDTLLAMGVPPEKIAVKPDYYFTQPTP